MSSFYIECGKYHEVKNLGWLLRHWQEVEYLGFNYSPKGMVDGQLVAKMGPRTYFSDYASLTVCWNWLNRPVFKGREFKLVDLRDKNPNGPTPKTWVIGDAEWLRLNRLAYAEQLQAILS